jgi:glucose-6-phosphate 1-dehydrogenase
MTARALKSPQPCAMLIFGAAGDLTKRKLMPALYNLKANGLLPRELAIIGVARRPRSHEAFRADMTRELAEFATGEVDERIWSELSERLYYAEGDFSDPGLYGRLGALLKEVEGTHDTHGNVLF